MNKRDKKIFELVDNYLKTYCEHEDMMRIRFESKKHLFTKDNGEYNWDAHNYLANQQFYLRLQVQKALQSLNYSRVGIIRFLDKLEECFYRVLYHEIHYSDYEGEKYNPGWSECYDKLINPIKCELFEKEADLVYLLSKVKKKDWLTFEEIKRQLDNDEISMYSLEELTALDKQEHRKLIDWKKIREQRIKEERRE